MSTTNKRTVMSQLATYPAGNDNAFSANLGDRRSRAIASLRRLIERRESELSELRRELRVRELVQAAGEN